MRISPLIIIINISIALYVCMHLIQCTDIKALFCMLIIIMYVSFLHGLFIRQYPGQVYVVPTQEQLTALFMSQFYAASLPPTHPACSCHNGLYNPGQVYALQVSCGVEIKG